MRRVKWQILALIVLCLTACQSWSNDMQLKLRMIESLSWSEDRRALNVALVGGEVVLLQANDKEPTLEDSWTWLERSRVNGKPVAHLADQSRLLPSTVVLSIEIEPDPASDDLLVGGPPKPAIMRVADYAKVEPQLLATLTSIQNNAQAAVLALRDGIWIEDAAPLNPDTARAWLGFETR